MPRKISAWVAYVAKEMKGKKFKSRADVNSFMKELSVKYKANK
jgi:hypothetical protein